MIGFSLKYKGDIMGISDLVNSIVKEEEFKNKYAKTIMKEFIKENADRAGWVVSDRAFTKDRLNREEEEDFYPDAVKELVEKGYIEVVDNGVKLTEIGFNKLKDI